MNFKQGDFNRALRMSFLFFVTKAFKTFHPGQDLEDNWHIWTMAFEAVQCMKGKNRKVVCNAPPRSLKSFILAVCYPAFLLGHDPSHKIILATYGKKLSEMHINMIRRLMSTDWYKQAFSLTRLSSHKNSAEGFETVRGGYVIPTSPRGPATGFGADTVIIDDINKASDGVSAMRLRSANRWIDTTLLSRLNNQNTGKILMIQQRLHENDATGHVLKKKGWRIVSIPAISRADMDYQHDNGIYTFKEGELLHPERYSRETLDDIRKNEGIHVFESQYQQRPLPENGELIDITKFVRYESPPIRREEDILAISWDIAHGTEIHNDWSVGMVFLIQNGQFYLLDVLRCKENLHALRHGIIAHAIHQKPHVILIERNGIGGPLVDELTYSQPNLTFEGIQVVTDKFSRMRLATIAIDNHKLHIPKDASWLAAFLQECSAFPYGKHDDQVDCLSQFLNWAQKKKLEDLGPINLQKGLKLMQEEALRPQGLNTKNDVAKLLWGRTPKPKGYYS
jgi:predicted phage terminase large subunit-like protein